MVSHLPGESWLPRMSISNCPFPNKEEIVWTMTSQNTQSILDEKLTQSLSVVFGTKSEIIRPYMFIGFHRHYSIWTSPASLMLKPERGGLVPLLRCRWRNSERCAGCLGSHSGEGQRPAQSPKPVLAWWSWAPARYSPDLFR